jgi:hypothetical protein
MEASLVVDDYYETSNENSSTYSPSKNKKVPVHLFNINTNGSVRQTGPVSPEEAYYKYLQLLRDVTDVLSEIIEI